MIYLIRHAHSDWTADEMRPLSSSGREAAARLAGVPALVDITAIYSSDYTRAVETVRPLADRLGIEIQVDAALRERRLGDIGPADFTAAVKATWDDFAFAHPGGESSAAAQARVAAAIRRIASAAEAGDVAIASHGNAIALFLNSLDPAVDFGFWRQMSLPDIHAVDTGGGAAWTFRRVWTGV